MPADDIPQAPEVCPGCGAVIVPPDDGGAPHPAAPHPGASHPGASTSCARLFEVTLRGLREEAGSSPAAASAVALADAAYDAQHPVPGAHDRLRDALDALGGASPDVDLARTPTVWRTTIADVAADLDVIDLTVLVESWARTTCQDWSGTPTVRT